MKTELKENRKKLLIETTKEIILEQGIKDVSARKIGERCGLSYATLYNYFTDLNELFSYVAVELLQDSFDYVIKRLDQDQLPKYKIINLSEHYYDYMTDNPNRFKIIFSHDFGKTTSELAMKLVPKVGLLLKEFISEIPQDKLKIDKDLMFELLASSIHAKMLFTVYNRTAGTKSDDKMQMRKEIEGLMI